MFENASTNPTQPDQTPGTVWLRPECQGPEAEGFGFRDPIEAIDQSLYVSPFWEANLNRLASVIGTGHVLFGSDWPLPKGLADPARHIHEIKDMPLQDQAKVMGGNPARLLKVSPRSSVHAFAALGACPVRPLGQGYAAALTLAPNATPPAVRRRRFAATSRSPARTRASAEGCRPGTYRKPNQSAPDPERNGHALVGNLSTMSVRSSAIRHLFRRWHFEWRMCKIRKCHIRQVIGRVALQHVR